MMRRIAIVGGSLAGVHAAEALRESGYQEEIPLVSADTYLPYDRPPLSKEGLFSGAAPEKLLLRDPQWYDDNAITTQLGVHAEGLDVDRGQLRLSSGSDLPYDGLIVATGSRARRLPTKVGQPPVHTVRDLSDAAELRKDLLPGKHLVLIGGGFIGLEVAATARQIGLEVTVIEVSKMPLGRMLGNEVGSWFRKLHRRNGVNVICGTPLKSIEPGVGGSQVVLDDGQTIHADVVVAGIGATPATEWLSDSGLELARGVRCNSDLSTAAPGVVAAGDIARWYNPLFDEEMRVEHWTNAVEQGRHAAGTLLGACDSFSSVPYFWTDQYNAKMRFVGRSDAADVIAIEEMNKNRLVALYGRDGYIRGAVCVNAPRKLAKYRKAIRDQVPWQDVEPTQSIVAQAMAQI